VTGRIFQSLPTQTDTVALIYKMDIAMEEFVFSMDTTKGKGRVKGRYFKPTQFKLESRQCP
jgi:hypothetical protein